MYTQSFQRIGRGLARAFQAGGLDRAAHLMAQFEARIDDDGRIEPQDWMPEATARPWCARSASTRIPKSSACCPRATGSAAPQPQAQGILIAKVQDEGGHGLYLYSAAGRWAPAARMLEGLHSGKASTARSSTIPR